MFFTCRVACMTLLSVFSNVEADFITINWNISRDRGNSYLERDYKYPMYEDVAPAPCDLTTACDAFCCQDPDCAEHQTSQCFHPSSKRNEFLSLFDCNCNDSDKPEWLSLFCYIYKNPIYLGKFFKTPKKIEKSTVLKSVIQKNSLFHHNHNKGEFKPKPKTLLGSPIMTFVPRGDSFPSVNPLLRKIPLKDSTYACTSSPVSYRLNGTTVCLAKISQELCKNGRALGISSYLVQSGNLSTYGNVPVVSKDTNFLEGLETEVAFKCVKLKLQAIKFKKQDTNFLKMGNIEACPDLPSAYHTVLTNDTCTNVLVYVQYQFTVNGSDMVKLKVEYGLTNISLTVENNMISKYTYLKQRFSAHFFDIMHKSYSNENHSRHDDLYNRGYFIGEELNFGYKLINNSSASWEKGILGVFGSGGSCDSLSPITFGFNFFSVCSIRERFPDCTHLRSAIEEKLEALLQGDSLGAYANLRTPYNNTVPLLRNYHNSSGQGFKSLTQCHVPAAQEIIIQYTSVPTEGGHLIHRVLGVRVDRAFQNVNNDADVLLTARASFFHVSSSKERPLSKFWRKMFSRELSENSWLNIFNAFEDVDSGEREEITFWCTALVLCAIAAVMTCTKVDVHLGSWLEVKLFQQRLGRSLQNLWHIPRGTLPFLTDLQPKKRDEELLRSRLQEGRHTARQ